jgi:hypothetical protein
MTRRNGSGPQRYVRTAELDKPFQVTAQQSH